MDYDNMILELVQNAIDDVKGRNNADYMPNKPQMKKLSEAYRFFVKYANENNGRVDTLKLIPKMQHCGITAYFYLFAPFGDDLETFKCIIQNSSALSIDANVDGEICISLNIPDVFIERIN